jgi:predicted lactoylglutathione lyase
LSNVLADSLVEHLHPSLLLFTAVGVEVNDLTVSETDTEALFNEHVTLLVISETGFSPTTSLCCGGLLKSALVINKLGSLRQIDGSTRLPSRLVVSGKLCTL